MPSILSVAQACSRPFCAQAQRIGPRRTCFRSRACSVSCAEGAGETSELRARSLQADSVLTGSLTMIRVVLSIFDEAPTLHLWATALGWSAEEVERAAAQLSDATFVTKRVDS